MTSFDQDYFIIRKVRRRDEVPSLSADDTTVSRAHNYSRQDPTSPPFTFVNGAREYNEKRGVKSVAVLPEILFEGSNMLVKHDVKETLDTFGIPNLCMHPAIYIHDDGTRYDDFWYIAFDERFDCWDRANSEYDRDSAPVRLGGFELEAVYHYSLDVALLSATPLHRRLLFQMGGVIDAHLVCHRSLTTLFLAANGKGVELKPIAEF